MDFDQLAKAGPIRTVAPEQLHGKHVYVYRNLHNGLFSVWHKGKVLAHVPEIHLENAEFRVRESGRQKVLREKKKNVHAFVVGTVSSQPPESAPSTPITYNPYMHSPDQPGSFVRAVDKTPISHAKHAHLALVTAPDGKQRAAMNVAEQPATLTQKNEIMDNNLKKAPPIPADALSRPHAAIRPSSPPPMPHESEMPSPWDSQVVSSAPAPVTKSPFGGNSWMNNPKYPLVKPGHAEELEQNAAINEFGSKMPRAQAEAAAYKGYKERQHKEASAHHLAGMKAARGAGDMEAARKHGLMYNLHSAAIGHEPVGPAHPDVLAHMSSKPSSVYKFKPHHGDQLALHPEMQNKIQSSGVVSSAPAPGPAKASVPPPTPPQAQLGKSEALALNTVYVACQAVLAKGDVVGRIGNPAGAAPQPKSKSKSKASAHYPDHDAKSCGSFTCSDCGRKTPSCRGGEGTECDDCWAKKDTKKGEMSPKAKKSPCVCTAYRFPHRHTSGRCGK
jgi:hypothetical protein